MRKVWRTIGAVGVLLGALTGCFSQSAEELYTPPKPASEYQQLDSKVKEVIAAGAEYAAPVQGSNTQQVQLVDLDRDGTQEAVAFFRLYQTAEGEPPLKVYIYRQDDGGNYQVAAVIEGDGSAIHSVAYVDLDGDQDQELVISWQLSSRAYQLMAYDITSGWQPVELMRAASYTEYAIMDLDQDKRQEVVALTVNTIDGIFQADYYDFDDAEKRLILRSTAPLSEGITGLAETLDRAPKTYLRDTVPALFITSAVSDPSAGIITDILAYRDDKLVNITMDKSTGRSEGTFRTNTSIFARDINGDGVLEMPQPQAIPDANPDADATNFWGVRWVQYDLEGQVWPVYRTYYNGEDGWYLILPEEWEDKIALSRADRSASGERGVAFSYRSGRSGGNLERFLTIYKLTGPNRTARSKMGSRFVLRTETDAIYAAEFATDTKWDCGVDQEGLTELFRLIAPRWIG